MIVDKAKEVANNLLTARDNKSFSLTKVFASAACTALIYNFVITSSQDFSGFGTAMAALIGAMAAKYWVEDKE